MKIRQLLTLLVIGLLHHSCEGFQLSIAHINDIHARFEQTSSISSSCHQGAESKCIGGLARVLTAARQLLNEQPNCIFLNAGDFFQGTIWYNLHKWRAVSYFMNLLPYDAVTIGNHDFDDGIEGVVPFLKESKAPVVVTNIDASEEPTMQGLFTNSTILKRGNQLIGVIGVVLKNTNTLSKTGNLKFLDEIETVNAEAKRLKAKGVNIIIALSHCGIYIDKILAPKYDDVDIVVGGHTHTLLYTGPPPYIDQPIDTYPVVVKQETGRTLLIVQAMAFTRYMGNLTVWFDSDGEVIDWEGNPILLDQSIQEDPMMLEELKPWQETVHKLSEEVVGNTNTFLNNSCRFGECNLANLITDAMVHTYIGKAKNPKHWTEVAIACTNAGGIRASISAGAITYGDAVMVDPFHNTWDVVEVKGKDLLQAMEESVSRMNETNFYIGPLFLHWSGVKVTYDLSKPAFSRVIDLSIRCQECEKPVYEELKKDYWYRLVVVSYVATGGDGLTVISKKHRNHRIGNVDIDEFIKYIKDITPFDYKIDGRITVTGNRT